MRSYVAHRLAQLALEVGRIVLGLLFCALLGAIAAYLLLAIGVVFAQPLLD